MLSISIARKPRTHCLGVFTDLPQNKNKFMTHISGFFNGTKFRCAHMGYMRFPKRTKNVTDRFLSRFWVFFHFKSSKTMWYWVFYDKIILNLRVSFLFKLFLFIGKSVPESWMFQTRFSTAEKYNLKNAIWGLWGRLKKEKCSKFRGESIYEVLRLR